MWALAIAFGIILIWGTHSRISANDQYSYKLYSNYDMLCLKCNVPITMNGVTELDALCRGEVEHHIETWCRGSLQIKPPQKLPQVKTQYVNGMLTTVQPVLAKQEKLTDKQRILKQFWAYNPHCDRYIHMSGYTINGIEMDNMPSIELACITHDECARAKV